MPNERGDGGRLAGVFGDLLVRRFSVRQPDMYRVVKAVTESRLTTIDQAALCELSQTVMDLEYHGLEGDLLEAGCGQGGAAIVLAHSKRRSRNFFVHDPFAGSADAETKARTALMSHGADERLQVTVIPGPYADTVPAEGPLALAHLDCGRYEPMKLLLERLTGRLVNGGQLIIDDYRNKEECRRAVDEYFLGKSGFRLERKSRLHVVRK